MEQKKIVVINELLPTEQPGAASIAFRIFNQLNFEYSAQYWSTTIKVDGFDEDKTSQRILKISETAARRSSLGLSNKLRCEYLGLSPLIWLYRKVKSEKPSIVAVHQIGNRIPRTAIALLSLMHIPIVCTLHDFGWLVPRKLFPEDLNIAASDLLSASHSQISFEMKNKLKRKTGEYFKHYIVQLRLSINRMILNRCASVIAISDLQAEIYRSFGFRIDEVIPNNVEKCVCVIPSQEQRQNKILLFAGRAYAKGLDQVFELVKSNPGVDLYLAGPSELAQRAKNLLGSEQFSYFGNLDAEDLFKLLHKVGFVAVLSECFDVYPTISLEAISHGALVLTNRNTGNSDLVESIDPKLLVSEMSNLDYQLLQKSADSIRSSIKFLEAQKRVSDNSMIDAYRKQFTRILTH